jgi:hypothetical protein
MRKMDDIVGNLFDPAADFLSRIQVQLDSFAGAALEDANDGRVGLQTGLILSEQIGANCCQEQCKKKWTCFMIRQFCSSTVRFASK